MTTHESRTERKGRLFREGYVVSDKMQKTVIVEVTRLVPHPIYKKVIRKKVRYAAHDEENKAHVGDKVRIVQTRPLSKTKRWRVVEVLSS